MPHFRPLFSSGLSKMAGGSGTGNETNDVIDASQLKTERRIGSGYETTTGYETTQA